jgi:hypothetical protein
MLTKERSNEMLLAKEVKGNWMSADFMEMTRISDTLLRKWRKLRTRLAHT